MATMSKKYLAVRILYQPTDEKSINWNDTIFDVADVKYAEHGIMVFSDIKLDVVERTCTQVDFIPYANLRKLTIEDWDNNDP